MPTAVDVEIVPFDPALEAGVVELQRLLWSPSRKLNRSVFEWKYLRNPYQSSPLIFLGIVGRKVVGMRGFQGARWEVGRPTETLEIPHAGDSVVAPGHRRSGLFRALDDAAAEALGGLGFPAVVSLSASAGVRVALSFHGWKPLTIHQVRWPFPGGAREAGEARLRSALLRPSRSVLRLIAPLVSRLSFPAPFAGASRVRLPAEEIELSSTPPAVLMSELIEDCGHDGRVRHVRDRTYLEWRYQNPLSVYRFLVWRSSTGIDGYLVLQASASRLQSVVHIVDLEARDERVAGQLVLAAKIVAGQSLVFWTLGATEARREMLCEQGFESVPTGRAAEYRPTVLMRRLRGEASETARSAFDLESWDLRLLYGDGV
jgi:hypothetical protein